MNWERIRFVFLQGLNRIRLHPWLSLAFLCGVLCINAMLSVFLGQDTAMWQPTVIPYEHRERVIRLVTNDAEWADRIMSLDAPNIADRALIVQQDIQCFTDTESMVLRTYSLTQQDTGIFRQFDLAPGEAGMTVLSLHQHRLKDGDELQIGGQIYTVRELPFNVDGGVDVLLCGDAPSGVHSYLCVLELAEGADPMTMLSEMENALGLRIAHGSAGLPVQYDLPEKKAQDDQEAILSSAIMFSTVGAVGMLFAVTQMSALLVYFMNKSNRKNMLTRQWKGVAGLRIELSVAMAILSMVGGVAGFALGNAAGAAVVGGSPVIQGTWRVTGFSIFAGLLVTAFILLILNFRVQRICQRTSLSAMKEVRD